ncbi:MAG: asparagine synthase (glutamine-hydrolyzing) [Rhodococcus sp.]|nr:asparagine synthase (glutamine-hydrolyzing) [Rhodococcus sp. (in: high G+C Gram-positive bacteria)]
MCGFAGIVGTSTDREVLRRMGDAIAHRGPDDQGYYLDESAGLAFRRLSIVDVDTGAQPMYNETREIVVVFNGEIYNHRVLRKELQAKGHVFRTHHADTEVLVHGWEEWGTALFPRLNGMFAVAIWDTRNKMLTLARDRYGIKPLYLARLADGMLVFGSEIRAIHASGLLAPAPDPYGIMEYFSFQNLWYERTMFRGVEHCPPATVLNWRDGVTQQDRFWDITFPRSRRGRRKDLAAEHRACLLDVMKRQIAADVGVKSYLSGGIDSTAITVAAHKLDNAVQAYSCTFDLHDVTDGIDSDEREYSRLVETACGIDRIELELSSGTLESVLSEYVGALEDLRMGMGYPVYMIAGRVAQDAKVVLSGTGGDEFHGGYIGRYVATGAVQATNPVAPRSLYARLRAFLGAGGVAASTPQWNDQDVASRYRSILNAVLKPDMAAEALTAEFRRTAAGFNVDDHLDRILGSCPSDDWRDRILYVDAKTYLHGLLVLEDKLSMAHSLETRVPLLDNELVDFVLDVPWEHLIEGQTGKVLFRESVKPWVPAPIYAKPKMGFGPPDVSWYRHALRDWISAMLSPDRIAKRGVLEPAFVRRVLEDHFAGVRNNTYLIWSFLNFEAWCERFRFYS